MGCPPCGRGFHEECIIWCEACHGNVKKVAKTLTTIGGRGAPVKDAENLGDPLSTGRKRAAIAFPLRRDQPCEWRGKKNVGGGTPITGCLKGLQQARHHGPIKSPLENSPGNVHRICHHCHNRWHAVNDPLYDELKYKDLPHNPELADELELLANEAFWKLKHITEVDDEKY